MRIHDWVRLAVLGIYLAYLAIFWPPLYQWAIGLSIIAYAMWHYRIVTDGPSNLLSFVFGGSFCFLVASALQALGASIAENLYAGPALASAIGWVLGGIAGITLFIDGCSRAPIDIAHGAVPMFFGFPLPLELRAGKFWWPNVFSWLFGVSEEVDLRLQATDEMEAIAVAPDGVQMVGLVSIIRRINNVYRHLHAREPEEILLHNVDELLKGAIENQDIFGQTATEASQHREAIRRYLEEEMYGIAAEIGETVRIILRQLLPPAEVMAAAARQAIEEEEADALAVEARKLTERATEFAQAHPELTREKVLQYLANADGKLGINVNDVRFSAAEIVDAVERSLDRFIGPRAANP